MTVLFLSASDGSSTDELREAVAQVQRENNGKILSAHTVTNGRQRLHRIKLLTEDGRIRVRTVPAQPGQRPAVQRKSTDLPQRPAPSGAADQPPSNPPEQPKKD